MCFWEKERGAGREEVFIDGEEGEGGVYVGPTLEWRRMLIVGPTRGMGGGQSVSSFRNGERERLLGSIDFDSLF